MILRRRHVRLAQPWKGEQGDAGWEIALCAIGAAVGREPAGAPPPRGGDLDQNFKSYIYPQFR